MNLARILVLMVALLAGGAAAWLVSRSDEPAVSTVVEEAPSAEVLVAARAVGLGKIVVADDLAWRKWPSDATEGLTTKAATADALEANVGSIARLPIAVGEPVTALKLVKKEGAGVLSVLLGEGMRAVALEIDAEKGAGGFILPNDRVDVLLTRKQGQAENFEAQTILQNVRVLAIDQAISDKDGQQVVVGRTATVELLPQQTEELAAARQQGTLSLALRALVDSPGAGSAPLGGTKRPETSKTLNVIRFGVSNAP